MRGERDSRKLAMPHLRCAVSLVVLPTARSCAVPVVCQSVRLLHVFALPTCACCDRPISSWPPPALLTDLYGCISSPRCVSSQQCTSLAQELRDRCMGANGTRKARLSLSFAH